MGTRDEQMTTLIGLGYSGALEDMLLQYYQDIYSVSTTAEETNTSRMIGISNSDSNQNYNTIDYAAYLESNGSLKVYENATLKGSFGTYTTGDTITVQIIGSTVTYLKNGVLLYTSLTPASGTYYVDTSFKDIGATLKDVTIQQDGLSTDVVWTNKVNVTATGNDLEKTGGVDGNWDAGAFSTQALGGLTHVYRSLKDVQFNYLGSLGYTGSLEDRLFAHDSVFAPS